MLCIFGNIYPVILNWLNQILLKTLNWIIVTLQNPSTLIIWRWKYFGNSLGVFEKVYIRFNLQLSQNNVHGNHLIIN